MHTSRYEYRRKSRTRCGSLCEPLKPALTSYIMFVILSIRFYIYKVLVRSPLGLEICSIPRLLVVALHDVIGEEMFLPEKEFFHLETEFQVFVNPRLLTHKFLATIYPTVFTGKKGNLGRATVGFVVLKFLQWL